MRGIPLSGVEFEERWRRLPLSTDLFGVVDPGKMSPGQVRREIAHCLETFGIVFLATMQDDDALSDDLMRAMGAFFMSPDHVQRETITENFQGGLTPEGEEEPDTEEQQRHEALLAPENYPFPTDLFADPKKRFMCKVGDAPAMTRYPGLTPATKIIKGHERLYELSAKWGDRMLRRARFILDSYAAHYGLDPSEFPTHHGAHFVAPTNIDFTRHAPGTVAADLHGDMGFVTGHDPSKAIFGDTLELRPCGGLIAWSSQNQLFRVVLPKRAQPWQAGFQLREKTGHRVLAGMHQVLVPPEAAALADEARQRGTTVSRGTETIFVHGTADEIATVHPVFRQPGMEYEEPFLGEYDDRVLRKIFGQSQARKAALQALRSPTA